MSTMDHEAHDAEPVSEAIVVVDLVDSTKTITRHGWYAVGRHVIRDLRTCIREEATAYGLCCRKFTGDGYMLAFRHDGDSAQAVVHALHAIVAIARAIHKRNTEASQERRIQMRFALHYGEVDAIEGDREGREVSFTFRLEGVDATSLQDKEVTYNNIMRPDDFPPHDYAVLSKVVVDILQERELSLTLEPIGILFLKGFTDLYFPHLLRNLSVLQLSPLV